MLLCCMQGLVCQGLVACHVVQEEAGALLFRRRQKRWTGFLQAPAVRTPASLCCPGLQGTQKRREPPWRALLSLLYRVAGSLRGARALAADAVRLPPPRPPPAVVQKRVSASQHSQFEDDTAGEDLDPNPVHRRPRRRAGGEFLRAPDMHFVRAAEALATQLRTRVPRSGYKRDTSFYAAMAPPLERDGSGDAATPPSSSASCVSLPAAESAPAHAPPGGAAPAPVAAAAAAAVLQPERRRSSGELRRSGASRAGRRRSSNASSRRSSRDSRSRRPSGASAAGPPSRRASTDDALADSEGDQQGLYRVTDARVGAPAGRLRRRDPWGDAGLAPELPCAPAAKALLAGAPAAVEPSADSSEFSSTELEARAALWRSVGL